MVVLRRSGRGAASTHLEKTQTATTSISHLPPSFRCVTKSMAHTSKGINDLSSGSSAGPGRKSRRSNCTGNNRANSTTHSRAKPCQKYRCAKSGANVAPLGYPSYSDTRRTSVARSAMGGTLLCLPTPVHNCPSIHRHHVATRLHRSRSTSLNSAESPPHTTCSSLSSNVMSRKPWEANVFLQLGQWNGPRGQLASPAHTP